MSQPLIEKQFKLSTIASTLILNVWERITKRNIFEPQNGEREVMSGVFLSIKDGKVVDQINTTCIMNENYICMAGETKQYQLQPTGKFKRLQ